MDDRAELIRQIKKIDIATGVLVEGLQTGFHHSVFKGQGIEFTEIRGVHARGRYPRYRLEGDGTVQSPVC